MKSRRQSKIVELITSEDIGTQEELAERLKKAGFDVTQATVSRDIRELKLSKSSAGGRQRYILSVNDVAKLGPKYKSALKEGFVSVQKAMNMVVIKTFPGMAMAVAAAVDAAEIPEIVGSIAGDDTIMCATAGLEEADIALEKIRGLMA